MLLEKLTQAELKQTLSVCQKLNQILWTITERNHLDRFSNDMYVQTFNLSCACFEELNRRKMVHQKPQPSSNSPSNP